MFMLTNNGLSMSQASMVTSIDDVEKVNWWNQQPAVQTDMHAQVDMDSDTADGFAIPSTDGRGEILEALNGPCPWITAADNEDACRAECYPDPTARAAGIHTGMTSYTPRMAYIRSTLQKILDFHMRNLVRSWEYATLDNRIWHPEPAYCTAQQHANTTLEPAPANAVNETLDLSASSRVMSLSAYVSEDEFEDDTEFGDAMMRLDVFEDFQTAKKWTIALRCRS